MKRFVRQAICTQEECDGCVPFAIDHALSRGDGDVLALLDNSGSLAGICGDPGWSIERRRPSDPADVDTATWPTWASVKIHVNSEYISDGPSEVFLSDAQFVEWVRRFYVGFGLSQEALNEVINRNSPT